MIARTIRFLAIIVAAGCSHPVSRVSDSHPGSPADVAQSEPSERSAAPRVNPNEDHGEPSSALATDVKKLQAEWCAALTQALGGGERWKCLDYGNAEIIGDYEYPTREFAFLGDCYQSTNLVALKQIDEEIALPQARRNASVAGALTLDGDVAKIVAAVGGPATPIGAFLAKVLPAIDVKLRAGLSLNKVDQFVVEDPRRIRLGETALALRSTITNDEATARACVKRLCDAKTSATREVITGRPSMTLGFTVSGDAKAQFDAAVAAAGGTLDIVADNTVKLTSTKPVSIAVVRQPTRDRMEEAGFDCHCEPHAETCNGIDDDCDGRIDEGVGTTYCKDADADGFGTTLDTVTACSPPPGFVEKCSDCRDDNSKVHPGQNDFFTENRGDGSFDYNCDSVATRRWETRDRGCFTEGNLPTGNCKANEGWAGDVPECGQTQNWLDDCDTVSSVLHLKIAECTRREESQRRQACR